MNIGNFQFSLNQTLKQALLILSCAVILGLIRPYLPQGIAFNGKWPTESTSAEDAYKMMAKPGDPPFASLQDMIEIQRTKSAIVLDARASKDFKLGRIPGSRNLPYYEIEEFQASALEGVTAETPLVIYCEGIGCELSFFLGRELVDGGFTKVSIFYGGYPEWKDAGLPIEK